MTVKYRLCLAAAYVHNVRHQYPGCFPIYNRTAPEIAELPYPNLGLFASLFRSPVEPVNPVCVRAVGEHKGKQ